MLPGIQKIGSLQTGFRESAVRFLSNRPSLNRAAVAVVPIRTQLDLGITSEMTPQRALKIYRAPLPIVASNDNRALGIAKQVFYAPLNGLRAITRGLDRMFNSFEFTGPFSPAAVFIGDPISKASFTISGVLFMSSNDDGFKFTGEEDISEVIGIVSSGDHELARLLGIVAELGKIEGAMQVLEESGINLDELIDEKNPKYNEKFADFIVRLAQAKEDLFALLGTIKPLKTKQDSALSRLSQESIGKNERIGELERDLRQLREEYGALEKLNTDLTRSKEDLQQRFNNMIEMLKTSDLGKEQDRANALEKEKTDLIREIEQMNERFTRQFDEAREEIDRAAPALLENEELKKDLQNILAALCEPNPENISFDGVTTEWGHQVSAILLPLLSSELPALRTLRDSSFKEIEKLVGEIQSPLASILGSIESARANIEGSLRAQITVKDQTLLAKNQSLRSLQDQTGEMQRELDEMKKIFDAYQEITSIILDFDGILRKARGGRLPLAQLKKDALGLFELLGDLTGGNQSEAEAKIPALLKKMVNKLSMLVIQEETLEEMANLTRGILRIAIEKQIDVSGIKVTRGDKEVALGAEEALANIDDAFAEFEE